jgi:hypothetical protein
LDLRWARLRRLRDPEGSPNYLAVVDLPPEDGIRALAGVRTHHADHAFRYVERLIEQRHAIL